MRLLVSHTQSLHGGKPMPVQATDDVVTNGAIEGSAQYSPMTLLMRYFNSQGIPPSAENIRRAIEQNAREPGTIPGLRNAMPEDSAPATQSTRVGAPSGGGGQQLPVPPVPPTGGGQPTTSAPPPSGDPRTPDVSVSGGPSVGEIASAIGLGGLLPAALFGMHGSGMPGASVPTQNPAGLFTPPPTANAPPATPGAGQPPLVPPEQGGIIDYTQLEPPRQAPLESALSKAVPAEPTYTGDMPRVTSDAVGNYRPGPSTPVENAPLPFNRGQRGQLTPPTAEQRAGLESLRGARGGGRGRMRLRVP